MKLLLAGLVLAGAGSGVAAYHHWSPCAPCCPGAALAGALAGGDDCEDSVEVTVSLDDVPAAALAAAKGAAPGVTFTVAERETEDGRVVYSLEGTKDGVRYEVEVTADGTVLETETGDDEDGE